MSILTQEFVYAALDAEKAGESFPIDFEDVWKALGYSRKQRGKDALLANLIEGEDYVIDTPSTVNLSTIGVTSPQQKAVLSRRENIKLSLDGYDHFAMMAQTSEGREARKEFIVYKKAYRQQLERQFAAPVVDPQVAKLEKDIKRLENNAKAYEQNQSSLSSRLHEQSKIISELQYELKIVAVANDPQKIKHLIRERDNYYDQLQSLIAKHTIDEEEETGESTFPRDFISVHEQMPYHTKNYLFYDVMHDLLKFREGQDYIYDGKKLLGNKNVNYKAIKMSEQAYQSIMTWGRPKKGVVATESTPRELTVKRSFITNHPTSKLNSANTFQPKQ